jgi:hypothetical protein
MGLGVCNVKATGLALLTLVTLATRLAIDLGNWSSSNSISISCSVTLAISLLCLFDLPAGLPTGLPSNDMIIQ